MGVDMECIYALRGAITVEKDFPKDIDEAVKELMDAIMSENELRDEDLASIVFSQTSDLKTRNAAAACRKAGYASNVPLFCCQEAEISGSLPLCIRVLITINHARKKEAKMVYLRGASNLRPDLVSRSK